MTGNSVSATATSPIQPPAPAILSPVVSWRPESHRMTAAITSDTSHSAISVK